MILSVVPREKPVTRVQVAKPLTAGLSDGSEKKKPIVKRTAQKVGRNDPCPCGSGKKYKKCCGASTSDSQD